MRLVILFAIVGCHGAPTKPDPTAFAKMTPAEQCKATEPRMMSCANALIRGDLRALGSGSGMDELSRAVDKELDNGPMPSEREQAAIHGVECEASKVYAAAVYACWDREGCEATVKCVFDKRDASPSPR